MKTRSSLVAGAAGILVLGIALPASAGPGDTTATVTMGTGTLSITVPSSAALGTLTNTLNGGTINGSLGSVNVIDARTGTAGWVASVISTALTPVPATPTIGAALIGYSVGTIQQAGTGAATYTVTAAPGLAGVMPVVTATGVTGDNSATWNPTITVAVPGGRAAGVYSGTITHSVV